MRYLRQHGCVELIEEHQGGRLSLYKALRLAHLPVSKQRRVLAQEQERIANQQLAAATITEILYGTRKICLAEAACEIAARLRLQDAP
jgi:hypothetical protein